MSRRKNILKTSHRKHWVLEKHRPCQLPRELSLSRRIPHGGVRRREGREWKSVKDPGAEQEPLMRDRNRGPEVQEESTYTNVYAHAPWPAPWSELFANRPFYRSAFLSSAKSPQRPIKSRARLQAHASDCQVPIPPNPSRRTWALGDPVRKGPKEGRGPWVTTALCLGTWLR